jgi:hypothetical protein
MTDLSHSEFLIVVKDALLYKERRCNATDTPTDAADSKADKINRQKKAGLNQTGKYSVNNKYSNSCGEVKRLF